MEFEDRRGQFLRILPNDMRREAFRRLNEFKNLQSFKEWVREQFEYERDWGMLGHSVHAKALNVETPGTDRVPKPSAEDMEELFALGADSPEELVLAVQKKFQKFFPRRANTSPGAPPGGGGKGGGKGARDVRCANCGKTGHMAADCRGEKRDFSQRPCYNCGKPGHVRASCPELKKTVNANSVEGAEPVDFGCVDVVGGWQKPRKPAKIGNATQKRGATFGDFLPESAFAKLAKLDAQDNATIPAPPQKHEHLRPKSGRKGRGQGDCSGAACGCGGVQPDRRVKHDNSRGVEGALVVPPDELPSETPSEKDHQKNAMVVEVVKSTTAEVNTAETPRM